MLFMNTINNFRAAAILLVTGIVLGALGAHLLKKILFEQQLISFETGVRYQIYGGFSVLVFSILEVITKKSLKLIVLTNVLGVCIFFRTNNTNWWITANCFVDNFYPKSQQNIF